MARSTGRAHGEIVRETYSGRISEEGGETAKTDKSKLGLAPPPLPTSIRHYLSWGRASYTSDSIELRSHQTNLSSD